MIYILGGVFLAIAYINGYQAKKKGYNFWRSFIFTLLLAVVVLSFLVKQFNL